MKYLSGEEILVIHAEILNATGGLHGVRDIKLFLSLVVKPTMSFGGKELYSTVFKKAAVYFESIARYHVFLDGNKRTALATSVRFLYRNGLMLTASNKAAEHFTLSVVENKLPLSKIAAWLKTHTKQKKK